ncbi:MAG: prolyl oligopeptidase family serine peptidase, partial [Acidimicrobiales bacterium]
VWFSNFADQRLWRIAPGGEPEPLTPPPEKGVQPVRYADAVASPDGQWLVCVRETHLGQSATEVVNEIVALPANRTGSGGSVLATGRDFYSFPRISPDGRWLVWTCWDHPLMPWDGAECWVAELGWSSSGPTLAEPKLVAGGPCESVFQPDWAPDGTLYYVSDAPNGWWNLHRYDLATGKSQAVTDTEGEWGRPQWVFGLSSYAFLADGTPVGTWRAGGIDHLGLVDASGSVTEIELSCTSISHVQVAATEQGQSVVFIGGGPRTPPAVVDLPIGRDTLPEPARVLATSRCIDLNPFEFSSPEPIKFLTSDRQAAHALFYPPTSSRFEGPEHQRPPLLVMSHGGPTSATSSVLDLSVQFWTSRGIAVVDVNYRGSTGYGRAYRDALKGNWGVLDVTDCVNAALYLVERGDVDGSRLCIRGASAGGYTTLCALTFRDTFAAGASYYGVGDVAALAADTHKFEARYLDGLIGAWPEDAQLYRARSPLYHTELLDCPVILFQGADDPVVPPSQAETMAAALGERGIRHTVLCFEGEQHGFRRADTLRRCLEAELAFYGEALGFAPPGG